MTNNLSGESVSETTAEKPKISKTQLAKAKLAEYYQLSLDGTKKIVMSPIHLIRSILIITGAVVIILTGLLSLYVFDFFNSLPNIEKKDFKDFKLDAVLRVHSNFRHEKNRKRYFWVPLEKVNRELIYAIIMSEDSSFLEHNGVNFNAMIDSLARNIRKREYESGASTITQQVVKNVYLNQDKSLMRKLKEILIARDLESRFTKNEILEVYLNIAEFGPQIYGVGMAGYHFFSKKSADVTADEGAYLALMLPSPRRNYFSIHSNHYLSKKNRRKMYRILRDMRYLEYLSPKQYNERRSLSFIKEIYK